MSATRKRQYGANTGRRYGGIWDQYVSPSLAAMRRNPKKTLAAASALALGALGAGMYTGHIPSPQFLRDAGNAVMGSETLRDLGQGFQHGREFTQSPGSYLYHGARALGNLSGMGQNAYTGLSRGIPEYLPSLYSGAQRAGQFMRDNPYSAGSIGAGLGLGMAAIAGMSLAARRKRIAALQQILATPPRTRREAQKLAAIAPEIRKEIFVLRNINSEYRAGFGRVR